MGYGVVAMCVHVYVLAVSLEPWKGRSCSVTVFRSCLCASDNPLERVCVALVSDYSKEAMAVLAAREASGSRVPELFLPHFVDLGLHPQLALPVCRVDIPP